MSNKAAKKTSPKLLVLCQLFYPELISTGQTLTELCEELVDMGVDVEVVCGPPTIIDRKTQVPKYMEYRGIRIKRVWSTRFPKLNLFGKIINQVTFALSVFFYLFRDTSKRPILVLTNPPFLVVICGFLRMLGGKPYIYLIFDVYPDTTIKLRMLKEKGLIVKLWNLSNKFTFKYASSIIVIGRCMQEVIRKKVGAASAGKIHTIHVWSDDNLIQPVSRKKNPFIKKWGLEGKFAVSYSGNMGRFHDMETIMEAAKILKEYKDIVFLFIGEGHKKQWIMEFADKWKLANCQFHSYVDRENLGFSLSCAHVGLVSLAIEQEGLSVPSKTFGLMAAGVPVIAIMSSDSEIAKVVTEEDCGLVIKPGNVTDLSNALLDLYNKPERQKKMGVNARKAIDSKYNLHSAAKFYNDLVHHLNTNYQNTEAK